jgi:hypothetical protein
MKLFSDVGLKKEITILDFGIVDAGESKTVSYYLYNDTGTKIVDLNLKVNNGEVYIADYPKDLEKNAVAEIKLTWKSSLNIKAGLKATLDIKAAELWS